MYLWTESEMNAFRNVFDGIVNNWHSESQSSDIKMSEFDFILETGDISQNGRRRPELTKQLLYVVTHIENPFNCWKAQT